MSTVTLASIQNMRKELVNSKYYLNIRSGYMAPVTLHCSYGDSGESITFYIFDGGDELDLTGSVVSLHGTRKDGANFGPFSCTVSDNSVTFTLESSMTAVEGGGIAEFTITKNNATIGTCNFGLMVEDAVFPNGVSYNTDPSVYQDILRYVQSIPASLNADYYTRIAQVSTELTSRITTETNTRVSQDNGINSSINALSARVDAIAALPSGSSSADAELIDARITIDGITKTNVGTAIRSQATDLRDDVRYLTKGQNNLMTSSVAYLGYYAQNTWHNNSGSTITKGMAAGNAWTTFVVPVPIGKYVYFEGWNLQAGSQAVFLNSSSPSDINSAICNTTDLATFTKASPLYCKTGYIAISNYRAVADGYYLTGAVLYDAQKTLDLIEDNDSLFNSLVNNSGVQLLKSDRYTTGHYYGVTGTNTVYIANASSSAIFSPIRLNGGRTYYFQNVYAYFSYVCDYDGTILSRLSTDTSNWVNGTITTSQDCLLYLTINVSQGIPNYGFSTKSLPSEHVEGLYSLDLINETKITVATDGSGDFSSVVTAVNHCNSLGGGDIYVQSGTYDIFEELGGASWIRTVTSSGGERQGLHLGDGVNLYGVGKVIFTFYPPDNITEEQSTCVSCINLSRSNKIENIEFRAKNCRYTCHDEANGGNFRITRYVRNCRFIHYGNASGLWKWCSVIGGGATGGSTYDWINCQFITNHHFQAFSFHMSAEMEPIHFNIDGCVGIVNANYPGYSARSFRFSYMNDNPIATHYVNVKCCSGNGAVLKEGERSGVDVTDNIELYNNGWVSITDVSPYAD